MSYIDAKTAEERRQLARDRWEGIKTSSISQREREILDRGFASVKTEFADLDGLKWKTSEVHMAATSSYTRIRDERDTTPFAVLSNAELSSFNVDETIRARPHVKTKAHSTSGKDLLRYFEQENESFEEAFQDVTDLMFVIPATLDPEQVTVDLSPSSNSTPQCIGFSPSVISPPQNVREEVAEVAHIGRPNNPCSVRSFNTDAADPLRYGDGVRDLGQSGCATLDLIEPSKKLRLPRLPKKYLKGSGADPYNPRYRD